LRLAATSSPQGEREPESFELLWACRQERVFMKIHLVGPGGAGKSTVGLLLSDRLNTPFVDLDRVFRERVGDISDYLERCGYRAYARENVNVYRSIAAEAGVIALSSGFMTYAEE